MPLLRLGFFAGLAFIGGVAVFMGAIVMLTSWQNGAIMLSYTAGGKSMTDTVSRAGDAAQFWRLYAMMGIAPVVLGAAAIWYGVRKIKQR